MALDALRVTATSQKTDEISPEIGETFSWIVCADDETHDSVKWISWQTKYAQITPFVNQLKSSNEKTKLEKSSQY